MSGAGEGVRPEVSVDVASALAPYEQVRSQLAAQISGGRLAVGTRLPTVRGLAAELSIAPNTVARAYRELEDAGLIETRGRAGSVVAAAGDRSRERAQRAAATYADEVRRLGLLPADAVAIVTAAIAATGPPAS